MRALAPPRQSGVLNQSLGFERPLSKARGSLNPWRGQEPVASRSPSRSPTLSGGGSCSWPTCRRAERGTPGYSNR